MSEIVDNLLDEVEQLEKSTTELEDSVQNSTHQSKKMETAQNKSQADANLLALEAAKTAQNASENSHLAAQTSIKHSETLKAQALEISESNFNWRQAVRNASKEFHEAKNQFTIMLITSIVFSLMALGAMGYLVYKAQNEQAQVKGEILDIIATENKLLNKKVTLKIDELAAVIETLDFKISQQNKANSATQSQNQANPMANLYRDQTTEKTTPDAENNASDSTPGTQKTANLSVDEPQNKANGINSNDSSAPLSTTNVANTNQKLASLERLLTDVQKNQTSLQSQLKQWPKKFKTTQNANPDISLLKKQAKQLDGIGWLVRKQGKTLESIQKTLTQTEQLGAQQTTRNQLKALAQQLEQMQTQISSMQAAIKALSKQTKVNNELYRYQAQ